MKERKMKKTTIIATAFVLTMTVLVAAGVSSCADANGLHDQNALNATIQFINFGDLSGDLAVAGDFNGDDAWEVEAKESNITMKAGEGTLKTTFPITSTWIKFSLCMIDTNWTRPWFPAIKGNTVDQGTSGNPKQNFYLGNIDLSAGSATIVVDGSKSGEDAMVYIK